DGGIHPPAYAGSSNSNSMSQQIDQNFLISRKRSESNTSGSGANANGVGDPFGSPVPVLSSSGIGSLPYCRGPVAEPFNIHTDLARGAVTAIVPGLDGGRPSQMTTRPFGGGRSVIRGGIP